MHAQSDGCDGEGAFPRKRHGTFSVLFLARDGHQYRITRRHGGLRRGGDAKMQAREGSTTECTTLPFTASSSRPPDDRFGLLMRPILVTATAATLLAIVGGASATGSATPAAAVENLLVDTIAQPTVAAMLPTTTVTATTPTEAASSVASALPQAADSAIPIATPEAIATSTVTVRPTQPTASSSSTVAAASTSGDVDQPPRNALRATSPLEEDGITDDDALAADKTEADAQEQALVPSADATASGGATPSSSTTSTSTRTSSGMTSSTHSGSGSAATSSPSLRSKRQSSLSDDEGKKADKKGSDADTDKSGSDYLDPSLNNACVCKDVRKVSLMSASDYCLPPSAPIGNKCGNAAVGEKGECPRAGAQPCQDTGHVLSNDSVCAYDKRDETFKCVASKEDLYIQKHGKRRKKAGSNSSSVPSGRSAAAPRGHAPSAVHAILLVASLVVGIAAVA